MTITVSSIISRAGTILQDAGLTRWTENELLGWINEAQRVIVTLRPTTNVINTAFKLASGTKQTLPDNYHSLLDVMRNLGAAGTTPGRAIRLTTRESLDSADPDWHASTPNPIVSNYVYNPADSRVFYVYPPQPVTTYYVELICSAFPDNCVVGGNLSLDDGYDVAVLDYVLYRAFSKDAEVAASASRAATHLSMFTALFGNQDGNNVPGQNLAPFNPTGPTG